MKYIIFDKRFAIMFHEVIVHSDVKVGSYPGKPTSAGFVTLVPINRSAKESFLNATVHGESISLKLKSGGDEDEAIIEKLINS